MLGQLIPWLERAENANAGFDGMMEYLRARIPDHAPPCRTTLAKWLDGQILINSSIDPSPLLEGHNGEDEDTRNTRVFQTAVQAATAMLRDTYSIRDLGSVVFVAEMEVCMYTRRMRQEGEEIRKESARATVASTVFAAFSINEGLIMMSSVPKRGSDAGIAPFMLDAVRNIQRRRPLSPQFGSEYVVVVANHRRQVELQHIPQLRVIGLTDAQMSVNVAAVLLDMCRPRILSERIKLRREIAMTFRDWAEKVEHRQRLLRSIVFRAWSGLDVDKYRASLGPSV